MHVLQLFLLALTRYLIDHYKKFKVLSKNKHACTLAWTLIYSYMKNWMKKLCVQPTTKTT